MLLLISTFPKHLWEFSEAFLLPNNCPSHLELYSRLIYVEDILPLLRVMCIVVALLERPPISF